MAENTKTSLQWTVVVVRKKDALAYLLGMHYSEHSLSGACLLRKSVAEGFVLSKNAHYM
jgi:hypothetical protein